MDHFLKSYLSVKTFREIKKYQDEKILFSFGFGLAHVDYRLYQHFICQVSTLGDSGFFRHQGIVKAALFGVFEDLKFKISEGSDQN